MRKTVKGLTIIALATASLAFASAANAMLIVDITGVAGSGQTTWSFSGSTTALGTGFFEDDGNLAGLDAWIDVGDYTSANDLEVVTVFGDATLTIAGVTRNINLVYIDDDGAGPADDFGVGVDGVGNFNFFEPDLISWTGSLLVDGIDLNDIAESGIPTTILASEYGCCGEIPLQINISEAATSIAEPATLALFGMGLAGLGLAARRRKTA